MLRVASAPFISRLGRNAQAGRRSLSSAAAAASVPEPALVPMVTLPDVTLIQQLEPAAREFLITGSMWNPASLMGTLIENVHMAAGTPWPVTIAMFTLGLRAALFPFTVLQTRGSINANNMKPEVERLRNESMAMRQSGQLEKAKTKMLELNEMMKTNGIGIGRLLGLGLLPVPFFMSTFFALQRMTSQPMPSMLDGGALWFSDLCAADPYFVLPILTTVTLLSTLEASRYLNPNANTPTMKMFMRGLTLVSIPVTAMMPSAMVLYFVVSNVITTGIQLMWRVPAIRRAFSIAVPKAMPTAPTTSTNEGFMANFMNAYKSSVNETTATSKVYERSMRKALRR